MTGRLKPKDCPPAARPAPAGPPESAWRALAVAEVGEGHLLMTPPLPCQDACAATAAGRPFVLVADGLGSRPLSHLGANAVIRLVPCYLAGIESFLWQLLDLPLAAGEAARWSQEAARGIVRCADAALKDLGRQLGHDHRAFQCTLLLVVLGEATSFWLQVGDGGLVIERAGGGLEAVGPRDAPEAADLTLSIRTARELPALACGLLPSAGLKGVAAFSDGAGERLLSGDGRQVARLLTRFLEGLRTGKVSRLEVLDFLRDRALWHKTSRDDRSLALLARTE